MPSISSTKHTDNGIGLPLVLRIVSIRNAGENIEDDQIGINDFTSRFTESPNESKATNSDN